MNVHISYKLRKTLDLEKEIHQLVRKNFATAAGVPPELLHLEGYSGADVAARGREGVAKPAVALGSNCRAALGVNASGGGQVRF